MRTVRALTLEMLAIKEQGHMTRGNNMYSAVQSESEPKKIAA